MLVGESTWVFHQKPKIISSGVVGGPFEAKGNLKDDFDFLYDDLWMHKESFEKSQQLMMEDACNIAIEKGHLQRKDIDFFISGDLINQITPTSFTARTFKIPYLGLFSACATTTESLALAAMIINNNGANFILSGSSSHNAATEKQYRYPTEYGGQKPPTSQWTVTGAGCALVAKEGNGPKITSATLGKIVDLDMTDPFHMGGAMAPAAVDTIITHLSDRNLDPSYYDLIVTGDLGRIGSEIAFDLLKENNIHIQKNQYRDCGVLVYKESQPVNAGASGAACPAVVTYGHLLNKIKRGEIQKMLVVATGALHSPLSIQQNESIPCIAHAVSIEAEVN